MGNESWIYQGRQSHNWFGHGTGPHDSLTPRAGADGFFAPDQVDARIKYVASTMIGHVPRDDRGRWSAALSPDVLGRLSRAMEAWQSTDGLSRSAFRDRFLDRYASDALVDQLRAAARGAEWGQTSGDWGYAGEQLAAAALSIGVDGWPRFVADLAERAMAAGDADASERPRFLRAVDIGDAPDMATVRRIAENAGDRDIDVVDARLQGLIANVIAKANVSIPGEANPMGFGTRMHKLLRDEVEAAKIPSVTAEESFIDGKAANYGEIGTIRTDVLLRDASGKIVAVGIGRPV